MIAWLADTAALAWWWCVVRPLLELGAPPRVIDLAMAAACLVAGLGFEADRRLVASRDAD